MEKQKREKTAEDGWRRFVSHLAELKSVEEIHMYFDLFLTLEEKDDLGMRYLIVQELLRGEKTQRVMAHDLGTSIAKITRGSNALKSVSPALRRSLRK